MATRAALDVELLAGDFFERWVFAGDDIEATFEALVYRHTAKAGFRTYDILQVASALVLGCETFWSFDGRAKRLAKLKGLRTNP